MRRIRRIATTLVLTAAALAPGVASACPNCKEAVANSKDGNAERLARGYSYSIYMMLGMPVALLGTGTFMVVRAVKRGQLPEF